MVVLNLGFRPQTYILTDRTVSNCSVDLRFESGHISVQILKPWNHFGHPNEKPHDKRVGVSVLHSCMVDMQCYRVVYCEVSHEWLSLIFRIHTSLYASVYTEYNFKSLVGYYTLYHEKKHCMTNLSRHDWVMLMLQRTYNLSYTLH